MAAVYIVYILHLVLACIKAQRVTIYSWPMTSNVEGWSVLEGADLQSGLVTSALCPGASACYRIANFNEFSTYLDTRGYTDIQIGYDVRTSNLGFDDHCEFFWQKGPFPTYEGSWTRVGYHANNDPQSVLHTSLPDKVDNYETIGIDFWANMGANQYCYINNVLVTGIPTADPGRDELFVWLLWHTDEDTTGWIVPGNNQGITQSSRCPGGDSCYFLSDGNYVERYVDTTGYEDLYIAYSMHTSGLDINDVCSVYYAWGSDEVVLRNQGCGPECNTATYNIVSYLASSVSDNANWTIGFWAEMNAMETCYLNYVILTGIPILSSDPSLSPTTHPSSSGTPTASPTLKPTLKPTFNPTRKPTPNPSPSPALTPSSSHSLTPSPTLKPTLNPTLNPTRNPTSNPTQVPTLNPTPQDSTINPTTKPSPSPTTVTIQPTIVTNPTSNPTPQDSTINPTTKPSPNPTTAPIQPTVVTNPTSKTPTVKPTQDPTSTPLSVITSTAPSPMQSHVVSCGKHSVGTYSSAQLIFETEIPFAGELTFDASASEFPVTAIEVSTPSGGLIDVDADHDGVITLNLPSGTYKFAMSGSGIYHVNVVCVSSSSDTTNAPSKTTTDDMITSTTANTLKEAGDDDSPWISKDKTLRIAIIIVLAAAICCVCCCIGLLCYSRFPGIRIPTRSEPAVPMVDIDTHGSDQPPHIVPADEDEEAAFERDIVISWLNYTVNLPQYTQLFLDNGYDTMRSLQAIDGQEDLKILGVDSLGHQVFILSQIKNIKAKDFECKGITKGGGVTKGRPGGRGNEIVGLPPIEEHRDKELLKEGRLSFIDELFVEDRGPEVIHVPDDVETHRKTHRKTVRTPTQKQKRRKIENRGYSACDDVEVTSEGIKDPK
eukprot:887715_1